MKILNSPCRNILEINIVMYQILKWNRTFYCSKFGVEPPYKLSPLLTQLLFWHFVMGQFIQNVILRNKRVRVSCSRRKIRTIAYLMSIKCCYQILRIREGEHHLYCGENHNCSKFLRSLIINWLIILRIILVYYI